jgi:anti-sigma factor RsiW
VSDHDLVAVYALDALDDDERAAFEQHLADCATCRAELAELRVVTEELAVELSEAPPARLRADVLAQVARTPQESDAGSASEPERDRVVVNLADRRRRPALWVAVAVGVAAAAIIAVLGAQLST